MDVWSEKALFIEYLLYLFEMNRRVGAKAVYIVRRQMEVIVHALRMGALLNARQHKRIRERLNELYDYAVKIRYLKAYAIDVAGAKVGKLDRLHLNSSTFQAMRKVHLQVSQSLPVTVAKSPPNCSSDIKTSEENQGGIVFISSLNITS
jgi:hypothetical protein